MERQTAHDFDQELLILFDAYVHGGIDRRTFLDRAKKFAVGGVTAMRLAVASRPERALVTQILGSAPSVDPVVQGFGWLVLIETDPPPLGTALSATVSFAERAFEGVVVPRSAVVRRDGAAFVYIETSAGHFERRAVSLLRPGEDGWLATGALAPGERVVVRGAQELSGMELAASAPAESD